MQYARDSYRDPRIRAVFAIAPAVGQAFTPESLQKITIPVAIVVGRADHIAPVANNAQFFATNIRNAKLTILPGHVGHYTFLDVGTEAGKKQLPQLFVDNPGIDREAVHNQVGQMAAEFFDKELVPAQKKSRKKLSDRGGSLIKPGSQRINSITEEIRSACPESDETKRANSEPRSPIAPSN